MSATTAIDVRPDVAAALQEGRPVVAMVSAPITHTLPWPANLETVRRAEAAAQQEGAVLAVAGVWQGRPTVGLGSGDLETLAKGTGVRRVGRRDLAVAVAGGHSAGTTVSASMYLAWRAGIRLLATGAIGGAARQAGDDDDHPPLDISADLVEMLHTPVAVVSAGARSVYNLARTADVLDSFRVPVIGYQTDAFPVFYIGPGSHPASARANTPAEVAALLSAHWALDGAGAVVAQVTPAEAAVSPDEMLPALRAVEDTAKDRLARNHLTPALMKKLDRLTGGKALPAYQAILVANVRLAAQVARAAAR